MDATTAVVVGALALLVLWEAWTLANKTPGDTISEVIRRSARRYMIVVFLAGVLCGHWFFPLVTREECDKFMPPPCDGKPLLKEKP